MVSPSLLSLLHRRYCYCYYYHYRLYAYPYRPVVVARTFPFRARWKLGKGLVAGVEGEGRFGWRVGVKNKSY